MSLRITVDAAREYLGEKLQQRASMIDPVDLPEEGVEFFAKDGVCGMFHAAHWPRVFMAHYAVKSEAWGKTTGPAKEILMEFWKYKKPKLIIGWTDSENRAALSFARRIGFRKTGQLDLPDKTIIQQSWRPQWA